MRPFLAKSLLLMIFTIAIAAILVINYFTYHSTDQLIVSGQLMHHTNTVIGNSEKLISLMKDVETGIRGYLLTERKEFLESFRHGDSSLITIHSRLATLTRDNDNQQIQLQRMKKLADHKLSIAKRQLMLQRQGLITDSLITRYQVTGKQIMDSLRSEVNTFQQQEQALLKVRIHEFNEKTESSRQFLLYNNWIALLFLMIAFIALFRKLLLEENQKYVLEVKVVERTKELAAANEELVTLNEELMASNEEIMASNETITATHDQLTLYVEQLNVNSRELKKLLHEKEVLLKEVYHRVKNNIGVISGLLEVQAQQAVNTETRQILRSTIERTRAILLAQERLYKSPNLAYIDLETYLSELISRLCKNYSLRDETISIRKDIKAIYLEIDIINTLGLIVNELVSNCLKYAFTGIPEKELYVFFGKVDGLYTLIVRDNGTGLPADFELQERKSLGWELVTMLAGSMEGDVTWKNGATSGLTVEITFREFDRHIKNDKKEKVDEILNPVYI